MLESAVFSYCIQDEWEKTILFKHFRMFVYYNNITVTTKVLHLQFDWPMYFMHILGNLYQHVDKYIYIAICLTLPNLYFFKLVQLCIVDEETKLHKWHAVKKIISIEKRIPPMPIYLVHNTTTRYRAQRKISNMRQPTWVIYWMKYILYLQYKCSHSFNLQYPTWTQYYIMFLVSLVKLDFWCFSGIVSLTTVCNLYDDSLSFALR